MQYDDKAHELVYKFLNCPQPFPSIAPGLHVLDVSRKVITKDFHQQSAVERLPAAVVKSASELSDAGVSFQANRGKKGIYFEGGVLNLPLLRFDSGTEPLFLNAIAFEKLHPTAGREVSSYVAFMQGLISCAKDVSILTSSHLIESSVGSDEAVANLMNKISKNVFFDPYSELCEVRDLLNQYYAKKMKKLRRQLREWWRKLMQTYFDNPWSILALLAATIILVLTLLQTIYTMKGYFNGSSSSSSSSSAPPPPSS